MLFTKFRDPKSNHPGGWDSGRRASTARCPGPPAPSLSLGGDTVGDQGGDSDGDWGREGDGGGLDGPAAPCRPTKQLGTAGEETAVALGSGRAVCSINLGCLHRLSTQVCIPRQKNLEFDVSVSCARGIIPCVSLCDLLSSLPIMTLTVRQSCCWVQLRHVLHVVIHLKKRLTIYLSILLLMVIGCFLCWLL